MEKLFKLKQNGTTAGREIIAGLTTFFAMAYIIAVNPTLLSNAGMEWGAVYRLRQNMRQDGMSV